MGIIEGCLGKGGKENKDYRDGRDSKENKDYKGGKDHSGFGGYRDGGRILK